MVTKIYTMNKVFSNNEKGQEQRRFGMDGGRGKGMGVGVAGSRAAPCWRGLKN